MKLYHYLEVNKLRGKFVQLVKNKGQIRIPIWGVGFYSGFWPEYIYPCPINKVTRLDFHDPYNQYLC